MTQRKWVQAHLDYTHAGLYSLICLATQLSAAAHERLQTLRKAHCPTTESWRSSDAHILRTKNSHGAYKVLSASLRIEAKVPEGDAPLALLP